MRGGDDSTIVVAGNLLTIEYAVRANGKMPAKEFIEAMDLRDQAKIVTLLE